ncbi:LysR family transcriptional regulator [Streptomyces sp. NPDC086783]|uniref:LysR family transcriptional regulator n=1 Tax=Streptomyces sp. NPDC086783 TaxID=3365758 RepID=UPI0038061C6F
METQLIRTFLTVARTENFTSAAAELHLSQSTVTTQVKSLEKMLGVQLFDRMPRGARMTAAARRLVPEAAAVLDAEARLRSAAVDSEPSGTVAVAAGDTLCSTHLPHVIAALRRSHPNIAVHLFPAGTQASVEGLRGGQLDLALLLEDSVAFPDLTATVIAREALSLVGPPGHPLASSRKPATWRQLADEDVFLHEEGCSYSDRIAGRLQAASGAHTRLTRLGSSEAVRSCVMAGLGISILPRTTVATALREERLAVIEGPALPDVPVQLVRHGERWTSPEVRVVVQALTDHFSTTRRDG